MMPLDSIPQGLFILSLILFGAGLGMIVLGVARLITVWWGVRLWWRTKS